MVNSVQSRMARAALEWDVGDLAERAAVSADVISSLELGRDVAESSLAAIRSTFETAGVAFIDGSYSGSGGPGVRLVQPSGRSIDSNEGETVQYRDVLENDAPPGAGG